MRVKLESKCSPEPDVTGYELSEGEQCEVCWCLAEEHTLDGCPNHPRCLNFYPFRDWEYLAIDDF